MRLVDLYRVWLAFALIAAPAAAATTQIRIACIAASDCASAMMATYDGLFAKRGLDAETTQIGIDTNIPPAIASGSIEIGGQPRPYSCKRSTAASIWRRSPAPRRWFPARTT